MSTRCKNRNNVLVTNRSSYSNVNGKYDKIHSDVVRKGGGKFWVSTSISAQNARTELPRSLLHKRVDTVANMGRVRTKTVKKVRVPPLAP